MKKIHLLILLKNYDGGTGTFVRLWCQYFQKHSSQLIESMTVISLQKPRLLSSRGVVNEFFSDKIYDQRYNFLHSIMQLWKELIWVINNINKNNPTIVLSVDSHAIILVELARILIRKHFISIHTIHNNLEKVFKFRVQHSFIRFCIKFLLGWLLNHSGNVVCISKELSSSVHQYLGLKKKPSAIYYGVETPSYNDSVTKEKTILSIGRFDDQKDFDTLLYAFKKVHNKNNGLRLVLVGDGPEKERLQKLIFNLDLSNAVEFNNWDNEVSRYFKRAYMFVLSSKWEGLSFVILEAMAYRLPIVASDCDFGPRELLRNGKDGILFKPGDVSDLVDGMEIMLNKQKYYRKRSTLRVNFFSIKTQIDQYEQVIKKALKTR